MTRRLRRDLLIVVQGDVKEADLEEYPRQRQITQLQDVLVLRVLYARRFGGPNGALKILQRSRDIFDLIGQHRHTGKITRLRILRCSLWHPLQIGQRLFHAIIVVEEFAQIIIEPVLEGLAGIAQIEGGHILQHRWLEANLPRHGLQHAKGFLELRPFGANHQYFQQGIGGARKDALLDQRFGEAESGSIPVFATVLRLHI